MHRNGNTFVVFLIIAALLTGFVFLINGIAAHHARREAAEAAALNAVTAPKAAAATPSRFTVREAGIILCQQYDRENRRAMYIIVDTKTGAEYLAVQGCGTSQLVTETTGSGKSKTTATLER